MSLADGIECVVLGGAGHASVVVDCLRASGFMANLGALTPEGHGTTPGGVPVIGTDDLLPTLAKAGVRWFVLGLGDPRRRAELFDRALAAGLEALSVEHPSAIRSASSTLGRGVQLLPGAVLNAGACLGDGVIVNSRALIEHDCLLGDHVHVAPAAVLGGGVHVGELAHVGLGAVVREGIRIGAGALIGAGAVVVADVEPDTTVMGVPAKAVRGRKGSRG